MTNRGVDFTFRIDEVVFDDVPSYRRHVVIAVAPPGVPELPAAALEAAIAQSARAFAEVECISLDPSVTRWRAAFKAVGLNPSKTRPAVEALLRRAVRGDRLSLGNAFVDAGTMVSLGGRVPVGVHALDHLMGDLVLGPAQGDETFATFSGEVERPEPGEIVYRNGQTVLTRRWVWRQSPVGSVSEDSQLLAINIDLLEDDRGREIVADYEAILWGLGATIQGSFELSKKNSCVSVSFCPPGDV